MEVAAASLDALAESSNEPISSGTLGAESDPAVTRHTLPIPGSNAAPSSELFETIFAGGSCCVMTFMLIVFAFIIVVGTSADEGEEDE